MEINKIKIVELLELFNLDLLDWFPVWDSSELVGEPTKKVSVNTLYQFLNNVLQAAEIRLEELVNVDALPTYTETKLLEYNPFTAKWEAVPSRLGWVGSYPVNESGIAAGRTLIFNGTTMEYREFPIEIPSQNLINSYLRSDGNPATPPAWAQIQSEEISESLLKMFVSNDEKIFWNSKQNPLTFDDIPTIGSINPVTSNGIFNAIALKQEIINRPLEDIQSAVDEQHLQNTDWGAISENYFLIGNGADNGSAEGPLPGGREFRVGIAVDLNVGGQWGMTDMRRTKPDGGRVVDPRSAPAIAFNPNATSTSLLGTGNVRGLWQYTHDGVTWFTLPLDRFITFNDTMTCGAAEADQFAWSIQKICIELAKKEDLIDPKRTAFNRDFTEAGGLNGTSILVARADHSHAELHWQNTDLGTNNPFFTLGFDTGGVSENVGIRANVIGIAPNPQIRYNFLDQKWEATNNGTLYYDLFRPLLPSQTGFPNRFLKTDGNDATPPTWENVTKIDVGLENVPNIDATNPNNIVNLESWIYNLPEFINLVNRRQIPTLEPNRWLFTNGATVEWRVINPTDIFQLTDFITNHPAVLANTAKIGLPPAGASDTNFYLQFNGLDYVWSPVLTLPAGTIGSLLMHNGSTWNILTPGAAGTRLTSNGTSAQPTWQPIADIGPGKGIILDGTNFDVDLATTSGLEFTDSTINAKLRVKLLDYTPHTGTAVPVLVDSTGALVIDGTTVNTNTHYVGTFTSSAAAEYAINHNLNTTDIVVELFRTDTQEKIGFRYITNTVNQITITFTSTPPTGTEYKVVILAAGSNIASSGGSGLPVPGPNGEVLTSTGSTWISAPLPPVTGTGTAYSQVITGDGTTTLFTITHGSATKNIVVVAYNLTTEEQELVQVTRISTTQCTVRFTTAPTAGMQYEIIVFGATGSGGGGTPPPSTDRFISIIVGDGVATSFTVTHNKAIREVIVQVFDNDTFEQAIVNVNRISDNAVTINFGYAVANGKQFKTVII